MPFDVSRLVLALLLVAGCKRAPAATAQPTDAGVTAAARDASPPRRTGPTDVTFLVASDTHFGFGDMPRVNETLIASANAVEGMAWPPEIGGRVAPPRGMVVTGDLTEWGDREDWATFAALYGRTGKEGKLAMPVFEMPGNHDKVHGQWIEREVIARHGGRFYAWDWDGLHLVSLGEAPDDEGIAFLKKDLAELPRDVPVAVFFHLALDGPWSTDNWFADGPFKDELRAALEGRRVAGIFHGHHHARGRYDWRGLRVYKPGAAKHDAHSFLVVRVTGSWIATAWLDFDHRTWVDASSAVF